MFKKIVCPVDLSERSFIAMSKAAELAKLCNAELVLLHVVEEFMSEKEMIMLRVSADHYQAHQKDIAVQAKTMISEELKKLNISDLKTEIVLREGNARKDINIISEKLGADLIVVSSTGRDFISEYVIGTTATALVHHAKITVMMVYVESREVSKS